MFAILVLAAAAVAKPNEAEKLFRDMEKQVMSAGTVEIAFDAVIKKNEQVEKLNYTLTFAEGNKFHLEGTVGYQGKPIKTILISDGTKMRERLDGKLDYEEKAFKDIDIAFRVMMARSGWVVFHQMHKNGHKPEEFFTASDFKLGAREKVGGRDTQCLQYTLTMKEEKDPLTVRLWLDTKTHLPVKRATDLKVGNKTWEVVENYSRMVLNENIDPQKFTVPKE